MMRICEPAASVYGSTRRNDAARDDVEAKKSSGPAKFTGIFHHDPAIDRSMQGR